MNKWINIYQQISTNLGLRTLIIPCCIPTKSNLNWTHKYEYQLHNIALWMLMGYCWVLLGHDLHISWISPNDLCYFPGRYKVMEQNRTSTFQRMCKKCAQKKTSQPSQPRHQHVHDSDLGHQIFQEWADRGHGQEQTRVATSFGRLDGLKDGGNADWSQISQVASILLKHAIMWVAISFDAWMSVYIYIYLKNRIIKKQIII